MKKLAIIFSMSSLICFISSCSGVNQDDKNLEPKFYAVYGTAIANDKENPVRPEEIKNFQIRKGDGDEYEFKFVAYKVYLPNAKEITPPKDLEDFEKQVEGFILNKSESSTKIRVGGASIADFSQVIPSAKHYDAKSYKQNLIGEGICATVELEKSKEKENKYDIQMRLIYKTSLMYQYATYAASEKCEVKLPSFRRNFIELDWNVEYKNDDIEAFHRFNWLSGPIDKENDGLMITRIFLLTKKL